MLASGTGNNGVRVELVGTGAVFKGDLGGLSVWCPVADAGRLTLIEGIAAAGVVWCWVVDRDAFSGMGLVRQTARTTYISLSLKPAKWSVTYGLGGMMSAREI